MKAAQPFLFDNEYRALARTHQSDFREKILCLDIDDLDVRAKYGNLLPKEAAMRGLIFYEGYRDFIMKVAVKRYGKIKGTARYSNLLRSEHIPLNIFTPMELNLDKAKELFNEIISGGIGSISEIKIEYPGKYNPTKYLHDKTSFDTFIDYTTTSGLRGGIGIEVKYSEVGYKIGEKEKGEIKKSDHPYSKVTKASGYYLDPNPETFTGDLLRQIWRNHILGAAMIDDGDLDFFNHIHLYPQGNTHYEKTAIPQYTKLLSEKGKKSFIGLTYENLFRLMEKYFTSPQETAWVEYLKRRYLF